MNLVVLGYGLCGVVWYRTLRVNLGQMKSQRGEPV